MKRKLIGVLGALLLAGTGTFALVAYVQSAHDDAGASESTVEVWVVKDAIAKATPAADITKSLERTAVPSRLKAEGAVTTLAELSGRVTATNLVVGEQLVAGRFVTPDVARQGDVPAGLLQTTVKLDAERAIGGQVKAGDTVAALLSFEPPPDVTAEVTHLELHKVLVTYVSVADTSGGATTAADDKKKDDDSVATSPAGAMLVTLALDAPSTEKLVFAAEHGTVYLAREPADAPEAGTQITKFDNVYGSKVLP